MPRVHDIFMGNDGVILSKSYVFASSLISPSRRHSFSSTPADLPMKLTKKSKIQAQITDAAWWSSDAVCCIIDSVNSVFTNFGKVIPEQITCMI